MRGHEKNEKNDLRKNKKVIYVVCKREMPSLHQVVCYTCICSIIPLIIGVPILVFGYEPKIYTSNYQYVTAQVIGYDEVSQDCGGPCNCRMECRPNKPKCHSWEKHRVCDYCESPCLMAWVVFDIIPPGPSYSFNGFYDRNYNPLPNLQSRYPLNWTMPLYYSPPNSVVYGYTIDTVRNYFIAGFVFTGIAILLILPTFICIFYYLITSIYFCCKGGCKGGCNRYSNFIDETVFDSQQ